MDFDQIPNHLLGNLPNYNLQENYQVRKKQFVRSDSSRCCFLIPRLLVHFLSLRRNIHSVTETFFQSGTFTVLLGFIAAVQLIVSSMLPWYSYPKGIVSTVKFRGGSVKLQSLFNLKFGLKWKINSNYKLTMIGQIEVLNPLSKYIFFNYMPKRKGIKSNGHRSLYLLSKINILFAALVSMDVSTSWMLQE